MAAAIWYGFGHVKQTCQLRDRRRLILVVYGIIPTFQQFPTFGRVYVAYGGVFVILAVFWGWWVDRKTPDLYDWMGALICLAGVSVMLFAPRN